MTTTEGTAIEPRFAFGRNWRSYAALVDERRIAQAVDGLLRLLPAEHFAEKSFLDIGCGSGLHALAASRLGVSRLLATDIDNDSVETTRELFARFGARGPYRIEQADVLAMTPATHGTYDIVYSWGVLHHTGDVRRAIAHAAALVHAGGYLVIALYGTTHLDRFWLREKRWYTTASPAAQAAARVTFDLLRGAPALRARAMASGSHLDRGMDLWHDLHDWLGGYPCEMMSAADVERVLQPLGLSRVRATAQRKNLGLFGSGCSEYVYAKV